MQSILNGVKVYVNKAVSNIKQSDWNETNPSDSSYIKNKPFSSTVQFVEVLNTNVEQSYQGEEIYQYKASVNEEFQLKDGSVYRIYINENEYTLAAKLHVWNGSDDTYYEVLLGNAGIYTYRLPDTGESFCLYTEWGNLILESNISLGDTVNIRLLEKQEVVTKLDGKFVDSIFTVTIVGEYNEEYEENEYFADKKFREIFNAFNNGMYVQANFDGSLVPLSYIDEYGVTFSNTDLFIKFYDYITDDSVYVSYTGYASNEHGHDWGDIYNVPDVSWNDLTDKPFGDFADDVIVDIQTTYSGNSTKTINFYSRDYEMKGIEVGKKYIIEAYISWQNYNIVDVVATQDGDAIVLSADNGITIYYYPSGDNAGYQLNHNRSIYSGDPCNLKITGYRAQQIDKKYIPYAATGVITGTPGQFVVIGDDGNATAKDPTYNYTYGDEDLEPGVSELETGKLYFVYE
jgi:hypothetical protein